MTERADVVVVGLGGFGSAALWRLAERGVDVVGIERFGVAHSFGSSHGVTRLFRVACQEHPGLVPIARRSRDLWLELGGRIGQSLVRSGGCLSSGRPDSRPVAGTQAAAAAADVDVTRFDHAQFTSSYPQYGGLGRDDVAVLDTEAGLCFPERNVTAHIEAAVARGATVYPDTRVLAISPGPDGVVVRTRAVEFVARTAIVTAGAWLGSLVRQLPLRPRRTPLFWFAPRNVDSAEFDLARFPAFIRELPDGRVLWGHGSGSGFGIKIGMEDNGANFVDTDPDNVDRYIHPVADIAELSELVATAFPDIDPTPTRAAPCMVTNSPDRQFLVGPVGSGQLLVAGGDSGHGFKHTAGVGELLAQLAVGETPYTDIEFLDPRRFGN
jgi:sarcosine oxidase